MIVVFYVAEFDRFVPALELDLAAAGVHIAQLWRCFWTMGADMGGERTQRLHPIGLARVIGFCIAAGACSGCIQYSEAPRRSMLVKSVNLREQPVGKFVFMRTTRSQSVHSVGDPNPENWRPPEISHLLLSNVGSVSLIEPAQWNKADVLVAPAVGLGRETEIQYRIYAKGFEVWRRKTEQTPVTQVGTENPATLTFTLVAESDSFSENQPPAAAAIPASDLAAPTNTPIEWSGAAEIIVDLRDDNLWRQIEEMWETAGNRRAIRFISEYYQDRASAMARDNPGWQIPSDVKERLAWLRRLVAAAS